MKNNRCAKNVVAATSIAIALWLIAITPPALAQNRPLKHACISAKTGQIINRPKCRRNETRFSSAAYNNRIDTVSNTLSSLSETVTAIPQPARVIQVATSGTAHNSLTSAILAASELSPTAENPVLIKVAPGTYSLPQSGITVPEFVHLTGSGVGMTVLTVTGATGINLTNSARISKLSLTSAASVEGNLIVLEGSSTTAFVEDLSIEGTVVVPTAAIATIPDSTLHLANVRIVLTATESITSLSGIYALGRVEVSDLDLSLISNGSTTCYGVINYSTKGVFIRDSKISITQTSSGPGAPVRTTGLNVSTQLNNVQVRSSSPSFNEAIWANNQSEITIENSYVENTTTMMSSGNGVVVADGGATVTIRNSSVITSSGKRGISAYDPDSIVRIANSFVSAGAGVESGGGSVTCSGITDENYTFSASTCPS